MFAPAALFTAAFAAIAGVAAAPNDIANPQLTSPAAGDVWVIGTTVTVTWDNSSLPDNINERTEIVLRHDGRINFSAPLAQDFDLHTGAQDIIVPNVPPAEDYSIVLFGDAGNVSPEFTITSA